MSFRCRFLICVGLALPCGAQTQALTLQTLPNILSFENGTPGAFPAQWGGSSADAAVIDDEVFHGGKYSARMERTASSSGTGSFISISIPLDFTTRTIELRGFIKTETVSDFVAIALREDGATPNFQFATTQGLGVKGTTDWKDYSVTLPVAPGGRSLILFLLLGGTGKVWFDDLRLVVDEPALTLQTLPTILGFENGTPGAFPVKWNGSTANAAVIDDKVFHGVQPRH